MEHHCAFGLRVKGGGVTFPHFSPKPLVQKTNQWIFPRRACTQTCLFSIQQQSSAEVRWKTVRIRNIGCSVCAIGIVLNFGHLRWCLQTWTADTIGADIILTSIYETRYHLRFRISWHKWCLFLVLKAAIVTNSQPYNIAAISTLRLFVKKYLDIWFVPYCHSATMWTFLERGSVKSWIIILILVSDKYSYNHMKEEV